MTPPRIFTEAERQWIRANWRSVTLEAMAAHLHCRTTLLRREAHYMGLPPRRAGRKPTRASEIVAKRKNNKAEREPRAWREIEGERSSPVPTRMLYACPSCGCRATNPAGHLGCIGTAAA